MIRILLKRKVLLLATVFMTLLVIGLRIFPFVDIGSEHIREIEPKNDNFNPTKTFVADKADNFTYTISFMDLDNETVTSDNQREIRNEVRLASLTNMSAPSLPGILTYLPHLAGRPDWITPKIKISKNRSNVSIVIGIPSIRRPKSIYIFDTLESLFKGMNSSERKETVIILCITEPWNVTYETQVIDKLQSRFGSEIAEGLLEIITPRAEFYPDLDHLKLTLGDNQQRVKWRSKQNLDYAYLMLHGWSRGQYYMQLEDDIQASPGYITSIKEAIKRNYWEWFALEFSTLGFIGRLFRSEDVPKMMEFLLMFYSSKPCDWLYDDFMQVKMCGHGEKWSKCLQKIRNIARSVRPSLFQHEGLRSSLGGTLNKLKDKAFGVNPLTLVSNPPVETIITTLQTYSKYDIYSAYNGQDIFWGANPKEGDLIDFLFQAPVDLSSVYIESGNKEHADDILRNATLEILPSQMPQASSVLYQKKANSNRPEVSSQQRFAYEQRLNSNPELKNLVTNDTFFSVGEFNNSGIASFDIPKDAGKIWVLRIQIHSASKTWILIQKIVFQVR